MNDPEIDDELNFHLEQRTERYLREGLTPEAARRKAREDFGNLSRIREEVREIDLGLVESIWQDVRYGVRTLAKSPGFTAVAVLSLALGIGLNSAIFSAINAVLLRPLPFRDPEQLVYIGEAARDDGRPGGINPVNYLEWRRQNQSLEDMAAVFPFHHNNGRYVLMVGDEPVPVTSLRVSANFFSLLGVAPALGRTFLPEEDESGDRVVVVSYKLWRTRLGSDPEVVGRDIVLDGAAHRVVGVLPPDFRWILHDASNFDVWFPNPFEAIPKTNRNSYGLRPIGRLKPGVSLEQAQAEMAVISQSLERQYPRENKGIRLAAVPLHSSWTDRTRPQLWLLWGAVGLVLLIACANVASVLMGRAAARQREIAIRSAIGAARMRLVRQFLTESILLAVAAATAGAGLAWGSSSLLNRMLPGSRVFLDQATVDPLVLAFTLAVAVLTGVLFGLAPALTASRIDVAEVLQTGGRTASQHRGGVRLRSALVVVQVALSLVLLAGTGLMMKSLWRLQRLELGFNPDRLLALDCMIAPAPPNATDLGFRPIGGGRPTLRRYYQPEAPATQFARRVVERLERVPGVESAAGAIFGLPFVSDYTHVGRFRLEGQGTLPPEQARRQAARISAITPGYFRTMGIRLLAGRDLDERDRADTTGVAIVSQSMARTFWPESPSVLGKRLIMGAPMVFSGAPPRSWEIVGMVADTRQGPKQVSAAQIYLPEAQSWEPPYSELELSRRFLVYVVVRTQGKPAAIGQAVRNAIREVDPTQPVDQIPTMEDRISMVFGPRRATMLLLSLFASVAVLLSAIGIYGVISYTVSQRTHEIGVRLALGARPGEVLRLVMRGGLVLALGGILIGSIASYWLTRLIANQLYDVTPTDPLTFSLVALLLLGVALLACYLPARRAAALDPMTALRREG